MRGVVGGSGIIGLALLLGLVPVYARPAGASDGPPIRADLEGRPIPGVDVGRYACHDLDFPLIRCFDTAAELETAVAEHHTQSSNLEIDATTGDSGYAKVYPDIELQGLPAVFSVAYDDLRVIGWNDRISSFEGLAGGGTFYRDIFRNGVSYPFGPYHIVTYVGDAYNDTFSSVWPG